MGSVTFDLGALAPHIGDQIPMLSTDRAMAIEGHRQAINRLRINGILSRSEAKKSRGAFSQRNTRGNPMTDPAALTEYRAARETDS